MRFYHFNYEQQILFFSTWKANEILCAQIFKQRKKEKQKLYYKIEERIEKKVASSSATKQFDDVKTESTEKELDIKKKRR